MENYGYFLSNPYWKKKFLSLSASEYAYESRAAVVSNFCKQIDERFRKEYSPEAIAERRAQAGWRLTGLCEDLAIQTNIFFIKRRSSNLQS